MKVLLATFWYYPMIGGVSTYMWQLKNCLEEAGHTVDIFARGYEPNYHIPAVTVRRELNSDKRPLWMKQFDSERDNYELAAQYFDLAQYDLIHTHDVIATYALSRVKPGSIPLVATIHGCLTRESGVMRRRNGSMWKYYATLEYDGVMSSNVTLVPTQWLKDLYVRDFHLPPNHINVIPYGIDLQAFRKKAAEPTSIFVPKDKTLIVCPARLDRVKGHYTLLYALQQLKKSRSDWLCLFVGDGPLRRQLEQNCRLLNLQDHVMFMGNRQDVPSILKKADIMVLASLLDNHPFVVMEAQISGKVAVVTDAGGIPEMVTHEGTGLISPVGLPDLMARNLERVLADRSLRKRLSDNAKRWGEKAWDSRLMMNRIHEVYANMLTRSEYTCH